MAIGQQDRTYESCRTGIEQTWFGKALNNKSSERTLLHLNINFSPEDRSQLLQEFPLLKYTHIWKDAKYKITQQVPK
jgi:hypothetical protein